MSQQGMPPGGFGDPSWNPPPSDGGRGGPIPPRIPSGPSAPLAAASGYRPGTSGEVSASGILSLAWATFSSNFGVCVGVSLTYVAIAFVAAFIPFVGTLSAIFVAPLMLTTVYVFVKAARSEPVSFTDMFACFGPAYFPLLVINLLVSLLMVVGLIPLVICAVAAGVIGASGNGSGTSETLAIVIAVVGGLIGIALLAFVYVRTWLAGLLYLDAPPGTLGITESISLCWSGTSTNWGSLILAQIVAVIVVVLSFVLLVIPYFIIGIPFLFAVYGAAHAVVFPRAGGVLCATCGYDMASLGRGATCPECGTAATITSG